MLGTLLVFTASVSTGRLAAMSGASAAGLSFDASATAIAAVVVVVVVATATVVVLASAATVVAVETGAAVVVTSAPASTTSVGAATSPPAESDGGLCNSRAAPPTPMMATHAPITRLRAGTADNPRECRTGFSMKW